MLAISLQPVERSQTQSNFAGLAYPSLGRLLLLLLIGILTGAGCDWPSGSPKVERASGGMTEAELQQLADEPLQVLVVGSAEWATEIEVQFTSRIEGKIATTAIELAQWYSQTEQERSEFDVLICPPDALPVLAMEGKLLKIPTFELDRFDFATLLRNDRNLCKIKGDVFGLSLGMPLSMVVYNNANLDDVSVLETWRTWNREASRVNAASDQPKFIEPFADWGAAKSLLQRGGALGRGRTQVDVFIGRNDGQQRIDSPPFVQALTDMKACYQKHAAQLKTMNSEAAINAVRSGKAIAAICWPVNSNRFEDLDVELPDANDPSSSEPSSNDPSSSEPASDKQATDTGDGTAAIPSEQSTTADSIAGSPALQTAIASTRQAKLPKGNDQLSIAAMPVTSRYYNFFDGQWANRGPSSGDGSQLIGLDGRVACILKRTRKSESAFKLIEILTNSPTAEALATTSSGLGPFKSSQSNNMSPWFGRKFSMDSISTISRIYQTANDDTASNVISFPGLPGNDQRIQALDDAVWKVLNSQAEPEAALKACAQQWNQIAAELDGKVQSAILNSLR